MSAKLDKDPKGPTITITLLAGGVGMGAAPSSERRRLPLPTAHCPPCTAAAAAAARLFPRLRPAREGGGVRVRRRQYAARTSRLLSSHVECTNLSSAGVVNVHIRYRARGMSYVGPAIETVMSRTMNSEFRQQMRLR